MSGGRREQTVSSSLLSRLSSRLDSVSKCSSTGCTDQAQPKREWERCVSTVASGRSRSSKASSPPSVVSSPSLYRAPWSLRLRATSSRAPSPPRPSRPSPSAASAPRLSTVRLVSPLVPPACSRLGSRPLLRPCRRQGQGRRPRQQGPGCRPGASSLSLRPLTRAPCSRPRPHSGSHLVAAHALTLALLPALALVHAHSRLRTRPRVRSRRPRTVRPLSLPSPPAGAPRGSRAISSLTLLSLLQAPPRPRPRPPRARSSSTRASTTTLAPSAVPSRAVRPTASSPRSTSSSAASRCAPASTSSV